MNKIQMLDCTLRDGGYCNEWCFGFENVKKIMNGLLDANIEIIECGFITNQVLYNPNVTKFTSVEDVARVIPNNRNGKLFVVMMNYGEYSVDDLPPCDGTSIDGVRVAFHKKDLNEALEVCRQIKAKGYLVFVQAMVSLSYTDEEFLLLIRETNKIKPYAFYIVDSFGMMKSKDLMRLFFMVEHTLHQNVWIGFHSHNNMQLAYSNAQQLVTIQTNRNMIIDASVHGMGRGAGNLNTELFVEYLNENINKNYRLKPLLILIDEILNNFYQRSYWGYSLPNYISATHNAHPNYAGYLDGKKTLTIEDINEIFEMMDENKKISYDKTYVEELYIQYMKRGQVQESHETKLRIALEGKKILLIAPGKSSIEEANRIRNFVVEEDVIVISINFVYDIIEPNYIFLSNLRRFKDISLEQNLQYIVTSNIPAGDVGYQTKYCDLLNDEDAVRDNAGLMAIKFLILQGAREIMLAGFDGYAHDVKENYGNSELEIVSSDDILDAINIGMSRVLKKYREEIDIRFLTTPKFVHL